MKTTHQKIVIINLSALLMAFLPVLFIFKSFLEPPYWFFYSAYYPLAVLCTLMSLLATLIIYTACTLEKTETAPQ